MLYIFVQAPQDARASPPRRRQRHSRDHTDVGSAKVLATVPGRQRRRTDPFSPAERGRRRR